MSIMIAFMRNSISLSFLFLLAACGSNENSSSQLSQDLLNSWELYSVDGTPITTNDEVQLQLINESTTALEVDCSGIVKGQPIDNKIYLLDAGYGGSSCHIHFLSDSHHVQLASALSQGASYKLENSELIITSIEGTTYLFK